MSGAGHSGIGPDGLQAGSSNRLAVLIVEDEPDLREEMADMIGDAGFEALTAEGVGAARALLAARDDIGVMISDIRMPDGSGINLTQAALRDRPDHLALEVILVTGHATLELALSAIGTGARDMLRKPVRAGDLLDRLSSAMARALGRRALGRWQARTTAVAPPDPGLPGIGTRIDSLLAQNGISAFAALSHELRTPLVPIVGFAELLQDIGDSEQTREFASEIATGGHGLVNIVDSLLRLVDLQSGRNAPRPVPFDMAALLRSAAGVKSAEWSRRGVTIDVQTAASLPVLADPSLIDSVLKALMRMAYGFAARGAHVHLHATREAEEVVVRMAVFDSPASAARPWSGLRDAIPTLVSSHPVSMQFCACVVDLHHGRLELLQGNVPQFAAVVALPGA